MEHGVDDEKPRPSGKLLSQWRWSQQIQLLAFLGCILVLIALTAIVVSPFVPALTWAVALTIISWRLHRRLTKRITNPNTSAALTTMIVVATILIPGIFITFQLAREAGQAAGRVNEILAA